MILRREAAYECVKEAYGELLLRDTINSIEKVIKDVRVYKSDSFTMQYTIDSKYIKEPVLRTELNDLCKRNDCKLYIDYTFNRYHIKFHPDGEKIIILHLRILDD